MEVVELEVPLTEAVQAGQILLGYILAEQVAGVRLDLFLVAMQGAVLYLQRVVQVGLLFLMVALEEMVEM
jgi:hypothetical protein